mmetsp:Transcript_17259/g.30106  ORF Transcript_17259/g.30106 Transcript_17259/m.30106 type:complete len:160 (-) Transcript_17259:130-609(-)
MTRGLYPPESLSDDDVQTLRVVRRDIYTNGAIGGGLGACTGLVLYTGAQWAKKFGYLQRTTLNRNVGMLVVMSGFALGTFLAASKTGKEEVHVLHPIFQVGAVNSPQQHNVVDPVRLQQMRMTRRKTLAENLHSGQGLNDSHSGRWVEENSETKFEKGE